jgi:hypothetical protein
VKLKHAFQQDIIIVFHSEIEGEVEGRAMQIKSIDLAFG